MFPEVLRTLLDRVPALAPAAVDGWRAAALPGQVYPALATADSRADGVLLSGISVRDWHILDAYEDDLYDLVRLPLVGGGHAWTYVAPQAAVLDENWSAEAFAERQLTEYVAACRAWRADFAAPGS
ncbi:gamma-glutamylcyclotransferase family protein [Streptodolium elevatio]|uniref:Putative gamma-glutamylcyclotransferase n=1 Tax=Streptodolium elevatio TaxID=3157996 RepID=A0ABV3D8W3_9ACTN